LRLLAELTLAMVLFTDAANADFGVVRRNLGLPERLLLIGLPLTIVLGFLFAAIVSPSLETLEIALLAAMPAPTDAALGKPVVTNRTVPAVMRESLNLESGLNDGICVPIVVLLVGLAVGTQIEGGTAAHVARVVIDAIGLGAAIGLALDLVDHLNAAICRAARLDQRALGGNPDRRASGGVLCRGAGGGGQRVHRMLCRRASAERAPRATQSGTAARRRAHGRGAGAADMGGVRGYRCRPHDRPRHLAGAALCNAQPERESDASGLFLPDRHPDEHRGEALHRLVRPPSFSRFSSSTKNCPETTR
jgi:hypothetical protein